MSLKHISGWVQVTSPEFEGPVDPSWGNRPPTDPGFGGGRPQPPDPGYDHPAWGGHPDNSLPGGGGHIWGALIRWLPASADRRRTFQTARSSSDPAAKYR